MGMGSAREGGEDVTDAIPGVDFHVDKELLIFLRAFTWTREHRKGEPSYIYTTLGGRKIYLHRLVFGLFGPHLVDHINRNKADNTLANLREATASQNVANGVRQKKSSPYRGVYRQKDKWVASIEKNYVRKRLYGFSTPEDAAQAYDQMAIEAFGEFAYLNFPLKS